MHTKNDYTKQYTGQKFLNTVSVVENWLGSELCQMFKTESYDITVPLIALLSSESLRISLEKIDRKYCMEIDHTACDARVLLQACVLTFEQFLQISKKIQEDLSSRTIPAWTTLDSELFALALQCNDHQLKALSEVGMGKLAETHFFNGLTILRTLILRMTDNDLCYTDMDVFKEKVLEINNAFYKKCENSPRLEDCAFLEVTEQAPMRATYKNRCVFPGFFRQLSMIPTKDCAINTACMLL